MLGWGRREVGGKKSTVGTSQTERIQRGIFNQHRLCASCLSTRGTLGYLIPPFISSFSPYTANLQLHRKVTHSGAGGNTAMLLLWGMSRREVNPGRDEPLLRNRFDVAVIVRWRTRRFAICFWC